MDLERINAILRALVQLMLALALLGLALFLFYIPHAEHPIYRPDLPHPEHPIYYPGTGDNVPSHPIVIPPGEPATLPAYLKCEWQAGLPPPGTEPEPH